MTDFEIAISLALIVSNFIFGFVCASLFNRTKRNEIAIRVIDYRMDSLVKLVHSTIRTLLKETSINKEETNKNEETNDWENIYEGIKTLLNSYHGANTEYNTFNRINKLIEMRDIAKKHVNNAADS